MMFVMSSQPIPRIDLSGVDPSRVTITEHSPAAVNGPRLPSNTLTVLPAWFTNARSGALSVFKSPTATAMGFRPGGVVDGGSKVKSHSPAAR